MENYIYINQEILERISQNCPEALSTYFHCFNRMSKDNSCFFSREMIDIEMSENFRTFRNNIKKLARQNLLLWHPLDDGISVILMMDQDESE